METGLSDQQQVLDEKGWVGRFLLALRFETDKPVVAGINGAAVGAGLSLAMAADIRIAADTARLHPGYLRAGTSPDGGLTWSLPTLVGHENAMRFLLESRFVDADEALRRGLVSEVVPADQLEQRLIDLCESISTQAPLAVQRTKRLVARTPLVTDVDARVVDEIRNALAGLASEDHSLHAHFLRPVQGGREILGYATDWTGIGGRPLDLEGDTSGMVSLDHAAWFHRPARVDGWLLQDVQSLVNAGGRGTLRGVIRDVEGRIVASMAQEMLLRRLTP